MCIGEAHALLGEGIDVGGLDLAIRIICRHIAIAQIIGQDIDDVGKFFRLCDSRKRSSYNHKR